MMKIHACLLMTILLIHDRSPRVGSYAFASLFDRKVPEAMRLVFERDMVTNQPKFCCAYKHVGREVLNDYRSRDDTTKINILSNNFSLVRIPHLPS